MESLSKDMYNFGLKMMAKIGIRFRPLITSIVMPKIVFLDAYSTLTVKQCMNNLYDVFYCLELFCLISKCLFGVIVWTKIANNIVRISALKVFMASLGLLGH